MIVYVLVHVIDAPIASTWGAPQSNAAPPLIVLSVTVYWVEARLTLPLLVMT